MQRKTKENITAGRGWRHWIPLGLIGIALAGSPGLSGANVTICAEPGGVLALRVNFQASLENAVMVSDSAGRRVVGFNNFFGWGAGSEWEHGAATWQSPPHSARHCLHIAGLHRAGPFQPALPWQPSACRVSGQWISYEDGDPGNDMHYDDAFVEVLGGHIDAVEAPCQRVSPVRIGNDFSMNYYKRAKPPAVASSDETANNRWPWQGTATGSAGSPPGTASAVGLPELSFPPAGPSARPRVPNVVLGSARPAPSAPAFRLPELSFPPPGPSARPRVPSAVLGSARAAPSEPATATGSPPSTAPVFRLPEFPFPPPDPSARLRIPNTVLTSRIASPTLGSVANRMENALAGNGYSELSYFAVPEGFTLVTQLERINPDATPAVEQRWNIKVEPVSLESFSLAAYLRALLQKDAGFFRVIAFVFTAEPFTANGRQVPVDEAIKWIDKGANALPRDVAARRYGEDMVCTALIYEFEIRSHGADAQLRKPSRHDGTAHLRASGILRALGE